MTILLAQTDLLARCGCQVPLYWSALSGPISPLAPYSIPHTFSLLIVLADAAGVLASPQNNRGSVLMMPPFQGHATGHI